MEQRMGGGLLTGQVHSPVNIPKIALVLALVSFLVWLGLYNYLLFHTIIELFTVLVAFSITMIAINRGADTSIGRMLFFVGIAYGFIGVYDLLHALSYKGMSFFYGNTGNISTQLWVGARFLESFSFLFALNYINSANLKKNIITFSIVALLVLVSIFVGFFPDCFIEGEGLTPFKIISELIIILVLLRVYFLLHRRKVSKDIQVYTLLKYAILATILTELFFISYSDFYGYAKITGHIFKAISFYFIYKAIVERNLRHPYIRLKDISRKLSYTSKKNRAILHSISDIFFTVDREGNFTYLNKRAKEVVEEKNLGNNLRDIISGDFSVSFEKYQQGQLEGRIINLEGFSSILNQWVEVNAYPHNNGLTVCLKDISQRKQLENEMMRLGQFEVMGQMAASLAHEIRNPLTVVRGFLQLMQKQNGIGQFNGQYQLIIDELDRANEIITEYLAMSKSGPRDLVRQDLNKIIVTLHPLLSSHSLKDNKTVELEELPGLELDEQQIKQLIINIAKNGLESMEPYGTLTIQTRREQDGVVLAIADQGGGIPQDVLENLGQPFLTTKATGTGLGLTICKKIIEDHQATLDIDTSPQGTTFRIRFFSTIDSK